MGLSFEAIAHEMYTKITTAATCVTMLTELAETSNAGTADDDGRNATMTRLRRALDEAKELNSVLRGPRTQSAPTSVRTALQRAAQGCRRIGGTALSHPERISITEGSPCKANDDMVRANPAALVIVFFNIFLNAAQQVEVCAGLRRNGTIRYSCHARVDQDRRPWVVVHIDDTAQGIHRDDWERVFEAGYSTRPYGTGMGLSICRQLVGRVQDGARQGYVRIARSVIWRGSRVVVALPALGLGD
jgi:signal transduction histidine kinase